MNIRLLAFLLLSVWVGTVSAASCSVSTSQQLPKPAWANMQAPEGDDKFYGIGIADIVGGDIARALADARSKANAELAQSIRVTVSSTIQSSEGKLTENGKTAIRSSFDAVSDSVANLTLQSVALDGQWVDTSECHLWLRLSLSRQEAQRAQKLEIAKGMATSFEAQMAIAELSSRSVPERERALAASGEILPLLDPVQVPTFSVDAARIRLEASRAQVSDARGLYAQYGEQLALHLRAFGQMTAASGAGPKRVAATSAMTALQSMSGLAPDGMPGLPLPFNLDQRMTALFIELGTPCTASKWFVERGKPVPAQFVGTGQSCVAADISRERRQMYLAGRTVQLSCVITLDGQTHSWEKVCANMQEKLLRDGVVLIASPMQAKGSVHIMKISATGAMKKRVDPESQTIFYRFEGVIATAFNGPNQVDIADQYEGITGWNPVSAAMTTDVLALNVASRLDAAISKHWEK
jgi:hypothetical protein